ncbi:MAG: hypothetical protein QNJ85_04725 [Gammaproteobacteria bacterium]|nr:hypothetical protein [Gammaproteobacteria bacterium]
MSRYPSPENVEIQPQARTFILFALTLAYPMFGAGFELGAYGELVYERKITAWAVVTAVWLGFALVPRNQTGIRNWQLLALAVPCLWLLAIGFFSTAGEDPVTRPLVFTLGLVSYLLCFPLAVYLAIKVANPDLLNLHGWKPKAGIVAIGLLFVAAGYLIGDHNYLFLECGDFEIAGDMMPDDCRR